MINFSIEKKDLLILSAVLVFLIGAGFAIAYGTSNPAIMGHTAGEIEGMAIQGEGASMNLLGSGTYSVLIFSTYFDCYDFSTSLRLDGADIKTYSGAGADTDGCDQNTIMTKLTGIAAGSHTWSISRGSQHSFIWIATKE